MMGMHGFMMGMRSEPLRQTEEAEMSSIFEARFTTIYVYIYNTDIVPSGSMETFLESIAWSSRITLETLEVLIGPSTTSWIEIREFLSSDSNYYLRCLFGLPAYVQTVMLCMSRSLEYTNHGQKDQQQLGAGSHEQVLMSRCLMYRWSWASAHELVRKCS